MALWFGGGSFFLNEHWVMYLHSDWDTVASCLFQRLLATKLRLRNFIPHFGVFVLHRLHPTHQSTT